MSKERKLYCITVIINGERRSVDMEKSTESKCICRLQARHWSERGCFTEDYDKALHYAELVTKAFLVDVCVACI